MKLPTANLSLACWPGFRHEEAARQMASAATEPMFGRLSTAHVQLVPQSYGVLTEDLADRLWAAFADTQFRLHANVRVLRQHRLANLSGYDTHGDWFRQAARISQRLAAPAYTAHPGLRAEASMARVIDNARRCADLFGCPVGIEGQYPSNGAPLLVSSWQEYRQVFESGVSYAIDLSHLNILATRSGIRDDALLRDMLVSEQCIEVHVSDNDGRGDWHQVCEHPLWWAPLLAHLHPKAVVFSEGNHRRRRTHP